MLLRLRRAWRRSAARRRPRLTAETPSCVRYVLMAACTSACAQQRVQPRATRSTTCSLLAGPLRCCRPASGSLRRATPSWTILGATASARTHATAHRGSPCAHPPAAVALTCTITHSAGLSRTIAAPTVGHGRQQRQWQQRQSGARRVCECVCVYVCIVGSSSQRFRQRKPRSISLKTARMRAKTPKIL